MWFTAIFEGNDAIGWSAYVLELPGVGVTGQTVDEARCVLPKAIQMHVRGLREDGLPVAEAGAVIVEAIDVPAA